MPEDLHFKVEKLVYGGDGLGHADGNTIFVPYVLPGEEVRAEIVTKKKTLIHARLLEVLTPAPERTAPVCAHYGACGGCHYQHIPYDAQVRLKTEILRETLSRLGGIAWDGPVAHHVSPAAGYRNRAQWAVRSLPQPALGYFQAGSSTVCEIKECSVLSPGLAEVFGQLQALVTSGTLPGNLKEIEAFADSSDEKVAINAAFTAFSKSGAELAKILQRGVPRLASVLLNDQSSQKFELAGPGFLTQEAGGFRYKVSHLSFFQVNRFLIEELLESVTRGATGALALDLYAGVGFFSLPLTRTFKKVISVDANLAATHDLRANAEAAKVKIQWHHEQVDAFLRRPHARPDFVVLDPPRAGLGAEAAANLAKLGAPEIVYLSCDPATLARDLAVLTGSPKSKQLLSGTSPRYEIASVALFDLFPQTYHLETLVRLRFAP
ncbi:MAG: 23S rRNA (uracil(1939)-C(5))-methyltransferase RlmD [Acidobacteriia bacterium]|nr:23S rRNA (uracil(1939)-C(5))-methyltransferase RlmD [Terriglobia bacterium]